MTKTSKDQGGQVVGYDSFIQAVRGAAAESLEQRVSRMVTESEWGQVLNVEFTLIMIKFNIQDLTLHVLHMLSVDGEAVFGGCWRETLGVWKNI